MKFVEQTQKELFSQGMRWLQLIIATWCILSVLQHTVWCKEVQQTGKRATKADWMLVWELPESTGNS